MNKKMLKRYFRRIYNQIYNWDVLYDLFEMGLWGKIRKFKFSPKLFYHYLKLRFFFKRKVCVPFLSFFVTTNCTLNCKQCCAFVNKYKKENHFKPMKFEEFKNDLDNVLKNIDQVFVFQLVGGEPLLCKDLPKMLRYAASKKQIKHIFITTNCTIMPSEELIKALVDTKASVEISSYQTANVKQYYDEIKNILIENKIRYSSWLEDTGNNFMVVQDIYEDKNNKKLYLDCFSSKCNTVCDGKFFLCPAAVYIYRNLTKDFDEKEIIDVRNSDNLTPNFIDFYSKGQHNICSYCHFKDKVELTIAGEQDAK